MRAGRALRLFVLLFVLACVVLYAIGDVRGRRGRNDWMRTLDVAFVLVREGSVDAAALSAVARRVPVLAERLGEELSRRRPHAPRPFQFTLYGPGAVRAPVPTAPAGGLLEAARHALSLHRFTREADRALGVPSRGFDARLYLVVRPPTENALVEGQSELGGRIGLALAELDAETVDTALFVAAHELFHTLGAGDRYGPDGRVLVPEGLVEPDREPRYPQRFADVMARNRPVSPSEEVRPRTLDELGVGDRTAREIGWVR